MPPEIGSSRSSRRVSLKAAQPAIDCASQEMKKIEAITIVRDHEKIDVRTPPALAQAGESATVWLLSFCSLSSPKPACVGDSGEPFWTKNTVARM